MKKKKTNKALHNIPTPDEDKMRFLYDPKALKPKNPKSSRVQDSKTLKVKNTKTLKPQEPRSFKVKDSKALKFLNSESQEALNSKTLKVKKLETNDLNSKTSRVQDSKTFKVKGSKSPEVQDIKTQAKYKTFKNLLVLFSNKDIDALTKLEREIMQNRDVKTERITKNSILRCLVKILPLIKFNKNKIPDENILMDRILKALEKKLNSQ